MSFSLWICVNWRTHWLTFSSAFRLFFCIINQRVTSGLMVWPICKLLQFRDAGFTFASGCQKRGMWTSSVPGPCTAHTVPKRPPPPEVRASRSQLLPQSPAPARLTGIWVDLGPCCATSDPLAHRQSHILSLNFGCISGHSCLWNLPGRNLSFVYRSMHGLGPRIRIHWQEMD